jgi:hypothetical protein
MKSQRDIYTMWNKDNMLNAINLKVKQLFAKQNAIVRELIISKTDLIDGPKMPEHFVTFCTYRRRKWLARDDVHQAFVRFATNAERKFNVAVGRYVIMPEHVHLFVCGDAAFVLGRWVG